MNREEQGVAATPPGHQPTASAVPASQSGVPNAGCENCRFASIKWRKGDTYEYFSEHSYESRTSTRYSTAIECRRYAPRGPVIETADARGYEAFPTTGEGDWCGEYQPAQATQSTKSADKGCGE